MNLGLLACIVGAYASPTSWDAPRSGLSIDVSATRSPLEIDARIDQAIRGYARNASRLTLASRAALGRAGIYDANLPFSLPTRLTLTGLSQTRSGGGGSGPLNLVFDASGARAFPLAYRQLLQDTFTQARSTLDAVFGPPSLGGDVRVRNFDADIGDRDAVAGGAYLHDNGSGEREIRFPVYAAPEAAAVNFVHCLLLAYLGPHDYGYDAFSEGLVRAATMRVARTAGALPASLDGEVVESVLDNTYDVGPFYDWFNQRALGGARFIAPNLREVPLPVGGSLGGVYLARYQMAGSAWQKVLVGYPGFAAALNQALYTNPGLQGDVPALISQAQTTIDTLSGAPNATVESLSFDDWFTRQHILETRDTLGQKLLVQPIPLPPIPGSNDFGVFLIQATYFETRPGGDEILLGGTSYPIFWSTNFDRIFPSSQEDRMPIAGAYGAVAPNIPSLFGGQAYRTAVDIPVLDKIVRTYVPAGGIATGSNPDPNDFYGTVIGVPGGAGVTVRIRVTIGAAAFDNIPVRNGAFGTKINQAAFLNSARCKIEVIRTVSSIDTVVIERFVNKGPGPLALDLRLNNGESEFSFPSGLPKGLSLLGLPIDPWAKTGGDLLGIPEDQVLAARYNSSRAAYDIYPNTGPFTLGDALFARMNFSTPVFPVKGKNHPGVPVGVALKPGWNMISPPIDETVPTGNMLVIKAADFPKDYVDAAGVELGTTFFTFTPGPNDAATGAPETGTLHEATQFEPGRGYFVRVLVPEGVTLLFEPDNFVGFARTGRTASPSIPVAPPDWRLRLRLENGSHYSTSFIGQSRTATSGYDMREDSGLPPLMGGLRIEVQNSEPMYQDLRRTGVNTKFLVKASGLIPNRDYWLKIGFIEGYPKVHFFDREAGLSGTLTQSFPYRFRARSSTRTFEFTPKGFSR